METLQRTANRGSISTGYDIDNSVKLEADNAERMQRTSAAIGTPTSTQKATISAWVKRTELQSSGNSIVWIGNAGAVSTILGFNNDRLDANTDITGGFNLKSTPVFRDTSAWYHIVWAFDTTQATAANRVKLYVNGVQIEDFDTETYPNQNNAIGLYEINMSHYIGWSDAQSQSGYYSEFYLIDGQQLAPTDFGEFDDDSGIWKPKAYTGTFGNEGYYIDFEDSANLGDDVSGNGNNFTALYNIAAADQATDTPTNNFCTFNPLMTQNNPPTISEGAMKSTGGGGTWNQTWGNMGVKNGKWYYEFKVTNTSSTGYFGASTAPAEGSNTTAASLMYNTSFMVGSSASIDYYYWQNGSQVSDESTGWGTISTNDIIGIALDLDAATKTFTVYKNGTALSGTLSQPVDLPTNMQDEFIFPLYVQYENTADEANFGGYTVMSISSAASDANGYGTFEIAPPTGYYALCTKNLAEYG
jgi:hypothetical protein